MIKCHLDMETQDPDDVFTLAIMATHPRVNLVGVTVTPGGADQVGLVEYVLDSLGMAHVPVGGDPSREKPSVSAFHHNWLGEFTAYRVAPAHPILEASATQGATLLTGGPLKNLHGLPKFQRWVCQGGFAGDSVVPEEHRLPKFAGKETCATFNFNGAPKVAEAMLASDIPQIILVSKNVCHGVSWDQEFQMQVGGLERKSKGLWLVLEGMSRYLKKNPEGKKLHDPLALAVAIEPNVCTLEEVEMYRQRGEWGAKKKPGSNTKITTSVDKNKFFQVLTECS